jgi:preprotein translocase subunit SecE
MQVLDFLRDVRVELAKVVWPSKEATFRLTILVIVITIIVGFFIGGIDLLLTKLSSLIINR